MNCDLHLHTTASDGRLTSTEVVSLAAQKNIKIIAITDHDSISGTEEALTAATHYPFLTVIPGVEINTDFTSGEVHILGYFINYRDINLVNALEKLRESRIGRAQKMIKRLNELGMQIKWERVQELARGESICRPHIAQALLEKGYVDNEREAFDNYIGRNGPAYIERDKVKPSDAVKIIQKAGGVPVLAHPSYIEGLNNLIVELIRYGLAGLEVYYGEYDDSTKHKLAVLAKKYNLLATGGSDYHHFRDGREIEMGSIDIPADDVQRLLDYANQNLKLD